MYIGNRMPMVVVHAIIPVFWIYYFVVHIIFNNTVYIYIYMYSEIKFLNKIPNILFIDKC